jgi:CCR4-NOT transcriptional regulation complex NOT5 subunit
MPLQVQPQEVDLHLKDSIEYYLESATESDFSLDEDAMYSELPLSEVDETIGKIQHSPQINIADAKLARLHSADEVLSDRQEPC